MKAAPRPEPLRAPYVVVDDFLPPELAQAMRKDIDTHFSDSAKQRHESHRIWDYWFVPGMYTYLRATPERVIQPTRVQRFMAALSSWSCATLGMSSVTAATLSLYIPGCKQGLHNDSGNGRFGFVYSLTPNERKTDGGETVVFHEGDPTRAHLTSAAAGTSFYTAIPPHFNRLVVFDDRMPHAVMRVDGSMNPVEGRIVLHGHLSDGGPIVEGALDAETVVRIAGQAVRSLHAGRTHKIAGLYHGPFVVRLVIGPDGKVAGCHPILDRVKQLKEGGAGPQSAVARLLEGLSALRFPAAGAGTRATLPILFGGDIGSRRSNPKLCLAV